jgi:hypothetical protein
MYRLSIVFCMVLLVLGLSLTSMAKDIPNAVGVWTFDDVSGEKVKDSSGKGNDGIFVGKPEFVAGKFGKAMKLNGTDSCIEVASNKTLDLTDQVTMLCWFNWGGTGDGWQTLFSKGPMSGTNENYALFINTTSGYFHFILTPGGARINTDSPGGLTKKNEWQFVAATYDGKMVRMYLDGTMIKEQALTGSSTPNASNLRLGNRETSPHWWSGMLDEMALFNTALTEAEINAIMKDGFAKFMAVEAKDKLSIAWGEIKSR